LEHEPEISAGLAEESFGELGSRGRTSELVQQIVEQREIRLAVNEQRQGRRLLVRCHHDPSHEHGQHRTDGRRDPLGAVHEPHRVPLDEGGRERGDVVETSDADPNPVSSDAARELAQQGRLARTLRSDDHAPVFVRAHGGGETGDRLGATEPKCFHARDAIRIFVRPHVRRSPNGSRVGETTIGTVASSCSPRQNRPLGPNTATDHKMLTIRP